MGKSLFKQMIEKVNKSFYPKCEYCEEKIFDLCNAVNYKGKTYHHRCKIKYKRGL